MSDGSRYSREQFDRCAPLSLAGLRKGVQKSTGQREGGPLLHHVQSGPRSRSIQ